ncbi:hypothetical protein BSL78_21290 [Apostichopus japonicus]|uniref:Uncharacterized protein n=1 Tax=Stichopus japonicus TaxID=307972 RepID=A0A2G8K1N8_STIJA|nr:hypothetical protein BSL78_21290 [Apostichopus japonicus]
MKTLMHLDASCNVLSTLPVDVGGLESLRELYVRRNQLVTVPEEISNLNLVKLDLSCNKITILPPSYRRIETLEELNVSQNPLENPPAQLCIRGKIHIFKFLSKKAMKDDKHRGLIDQQETNNWQRRPPFNHQRPEVVTKEEHVSVQTETEVEDNMADELAYVHDRMGELRRGMSGADSGYIEGDKRWSSSEASNEDEEARQLAERASQQKEHRTTRRLAAEDHRFQELPAVGEHHLHRRPRHRSRDRGEDIRERAHASAVAYGHPQADAHHHAHERCGSVYKGVNETENKLRRPKEKSPGGKITEGNGGSQITSKGISSQGRGIPS